MVINFSIDDAEGSKIKSDSEKTGIPVSELIRRAYSYYRSNVLTNHFPELTEGVPEDAKRKGKK